MMKLQDPADTMNTVEALAEIIILCLYSMNESWLKSFSRTQCWKEIPLLGLSALRTLGSINI